MKKYFCYCSHKGFDLFDTLDEAREEANKRLLSATDEDKIDFDTFKTLSVGEILEIPREVKAFRLKPIG